MLLSMDIDKVVHGKQGSFHGKLRLAWKVVHGQRKLAWKCLSMDSYQELMTLLRIFSQEDTKRAETNSTSILLENVSKNHNSIASHYSMVI